MLVLALGGEAVSAGDKGIDIVSLVSIVSGYLLLAALWFFVFRENAPRHRKRKRDSSD
jgi:hypothetical protein